MFCKPLSKSSCRFSNAFLITFHAVSFLSVDHPLPCTMVSLYLWDTRRSLMVLSSFKCTCISCLLHMFFQTFTDAFCVWHLLCRCFVVFNIVSVVVWRLFDVNDGCMEPQLNMEQKTTMDRLKIVLCQQWTKWWHIYMYNISILYKPGSQLFITDWLSRHNCRTEPRKY